MRKIAVILAAGLVSCGPTPEEKAAADARAIAEVEANQEAPPQMLSLDPISFADIENANLFGAGCNLLPITEDVSGIARVVAQADAAHFKYRGELVRMGADVGSAELPYLARAKYDGLAYSMTMTIDEQSGEQVGSETIDYPATITIRDAQGRVVLNESGTAQCGA